MKAVLHKNVAVPAGILSGLFLYVLQPCDMMGSKQQNDKLEFGVDVMNRKKADILMAYAFHVVFIIMSFWLMQHHYDTLQTIFCVLGSIYLIYWIVGNRKNYMPWSVYVHFTVGALAQILLNSSGVIPKDSGWFSGLGQLLYVVFLVGHTSLLGLVNLILYVKNNKANNDCM